MNMEARVKKLSEEIKDVRKDITTLNGKVDECNRGIQELIAVVRRLLPNEDAKVEVNQNVSKQVLERQADREHNILGNNNGGNGNGGNGNDSGDNMLERFLKYNPPRFLGEPDDEKTEALLKRDEKAEAWLERIENIYDALDYTDDKKITFAVFLLDGDARHWWQTVKLQWEHQRTPYTWVDFVKTFKDYYIPVIARQRREKDFISLRQGKLSVAQYEARFNRLSHYVPKLVQTASQRVWWFVRGLKPEIQDSLAPFEYTTYSEALNAAARVENVIGKVQAESSQQNKRSFQAQSEQRSYQPQTQQRQTQTPGQYRPIVVRTQQIGSVPVCAFCNKRGHIEANCWKKSGI